MEFTSLSFLLFTSSVVLLFLLRTNLVYRQVVITSANVLFIASYATHIQQILPLITFLGLGYGMVELVRRKVSRLALMCGLLVVLSTFVILKRFSFLDGFLALPFPYLVLGLSYILFRILQIMIDTASGELPAPISPVTFFNYTCNFLCFISGPIQRYQDFELSYYQPAPVLDEKLVFTSFSRIVTGYFKLMVISAIANYMFLNFTKTILAAHVDISHMRLIGMYAATATVYTVYLYANFSGYMDISLGLGHLLGQSLPENFNRPFLARNFLDFWSRWHMTLSNWFKTYLFNPLLKTLVTACPSRKAEPYLGATAFFVTFMIMGLWHGTTAVFVVYGLALGLGASVTKFWQLACVTHLGKKRYREISDHTFSIYLGRGMTCAYFTLALTCLWVDIEQLGGLARALGLFGILAVYMGISAASAATMYLWDHFFRLFDKIRPLFHAHTESIVARNILLALRVLLILTVASLFNKSPEFVYRAF